MRLFVTKTLANTELYINLDAISFIQNNSPIGYVIVFISGAAHNLSKEETMKIIEELKR